MDRSQNLDDQLSILNEEKQKLKEELDALQTKMQSMSKEHSTAIDKCKRYEERAKKYHHDNEVLRENIHKLQRMLSDTQDSNDIQKIEQEKIIRNLENQLETVSVVSSRVSSKGDRDKDSSKNLGVDQQIVEKLKRDMAELSKMNERFKLQNTELVAEIKDRENDENKLTSQVNTMRYDMCNNIASLDTTAEERASQYSKQAWSRANRAGERAFEDYFHTVFG